MFKIWAIIAISLTVASSHFIDLSTDEKSMVYAAALLCIAGMAVSSHGTMQHRAVLDVFFLWAGYAFIIDFVLTLSPPLQALETSIFVVLVSWAYFRPYNYLSSPVKADNVHVAFYGGPNAPFLSRLASVFGFPFSSIAIIAAGITVRPSKAAGKMVTTTPATLRAKGYVMIDTGIETTDEIKEAIENIVGTKTGYGFLRTRCLKNLLPVLNLLGKDWKPTGWPVIPSLYYRQCVRNVT